MSPSSFIGRKSAIFRSVEFGGRGSSLKVGRVLHLHIPSYSFIKVRYMTCFATELADTLSTIIIAVLVPVVALALALVLIILCIIAFKLKSKHRVQPSASYRFR